MARRYVISCDYPDCTNDSDRYVDETFIQLDVLKGVSVDYCLHHARILIRATDDYIAVHDNIVNFVKDK